MSELDLEKFNKLKEVSEDTYRSWGKIYCPYLQKNVNFNAKGLEHIKLKEWNKARLVSDQYLRLKFLKLAPEIIKKSHTLQEYKEEKVFERVKINSRWEKRLIDVRYYAFISVCGDKEVKVKIIVKEIGSGEPYFWSIIPFWRNTRHPLLDKIKKAFHEGNPESD